MNSTSNQSFHQSLDLSRRILELMKEGSWEEAAELEAGRLRMIRKEFAAEPEQNIDEKIGKLREIEALNREMESVARQGKSKISCQLGQIRQGLKAGRAYEQNRT